MVKKGYYENESLGLAWDCVEVRQVSLFTTTAVVTYSHASDMKFEASLQYTNT